METHIYEKNVESISQVLRAHNHPFTTVGSLVQSWMGSRGLPQDTAIDLLLRDEQLFSICSALIQSGKWLQYHAEEERKTFLEDDDILDHHLNRFTKYACEADVVLEITPELKADNFNYIRIWSENTYKLSVDEVSWHEVPSIVSGDTYLVQEKYFPQGYPGPALISTYNGRGLPAGRVKDNVILIPGLVPYLDALVYHITHYNASKPVLKYLAAWQIDNLTRYLYLEQSQCGMDILFEAEAETEQYLEETWRNYQRKPRCPISGTDMVQMEKGAIKSIKPLDLENLKSNYM